MSRTEPQVVITGLGLATPLGTDNAEIAAAVASNKSGLQWLKEPPAETRSPGLFAGALGPRDDDPLAPYPTVAECVDSFAVQAAELALQDSGLGYDELSGERTGCVVGTSKGALLRYAHRHDMNQRRIRRGVPLDATTSGAPFPMLCWPGLNPNAAAIRVAKAFRLEGPCLSPVAACATGLVSLARGVQLITDGHADIVFAGSSEASTVNAWVRHTFQRLGVLAKNFTDPAHAVRPFADDRDGFLVGEGAAVMVLESRTAADARGARIHATWLGSVSGADSTGITQIDESGKTLAEVIRRCLTVSGLSPSCIDLLNLHGTATIPNDRCEANAVASVFGQREIARRAYKSQIGHCLGAAGSIEVGLSLLEPGWTTQLKTSLGFGGHLIAAALGRPGNS
jgi:3-oxoacyl-[acyl-carrier-protein] synthase II